MNTSAIEAKKQSKAVRLTPQQSQLLAYFSSMKKSTQLIMIDIAEELAEAFAATSDMGMVTGGAL